VQNIFEANIGFDEHFVVPSEIPFYLYVL
jgi:hypothetical protein